MERTKRKYYLITFACSVVLLFMILLIYFNIPRLGYTKVEDEYYISHVYGNAKEYHIPATYKGLPVTQISSRAFEKKDRLKRLNFAEDGNITLIERLAFNKCSGLEEIVLPNSLVELENHVFQNCSSLKTITINDNLRYIGGSTFFNCEKLESVNISSNSRLYSIGTYAFYNCNSLLKLWFPDSLRYIYPNAFSYCTRLEEVSVSSNIKAIPEDVNCFANFIVRPI